MNIKTLYCGLLATTLLGGGLASCSTDVDNPALSTNQKLVVNQAPKFQAYSGDTFWGLNGSLGTRSSNTEANQWYMTWDCFPPVDELTQEDIAEIKRRLTKEYGAVNSIDFPYSDFWVQQVYKGEDEYIPTDKDGNPCNQTILGSGYMDEFGNLNGQGEREVVSNFNNGSNTNNPGVCPNCNKSLAGTTLKTDMLHEIADPTTQFFFHDSFGSADYNNYYIVEYKGYYYLGFDYEMHKDANNPGEVRDVNRDYKFTDWIVRIVPAYGIGLTPDDGNPGGIMPEDWYDIVNGTTPVDPNPDEDSTPGVAGDDHTNEVEVNLAVDTKGETSGGRFNESHLSIHVRSAVDVDMFIPMPLDMICPADDMEVVKKHFEGEMEHGGEFENAQFDADGKAIMEAGLHSSMTYTIKDLAAQKEWTVRIHVEYVSAGTTSDHDGCDRTFSEDGIHIWTEGLEGNTELFDYLRKNYGDGITFEIWNYFKEDATLAQLKEHMNRSTIRFIGENMPEYFINAFGKANGREKDCLVTLDGEEAENFEFVGTGTHLNASDLNDIYKRKEVETPMPPVPVY